MKVMMKRKSVLISLIFATGIFLSLANPAEIANRPKQGDEQIDPDIKDILGDDEDEEVVKATTTPKSTTVSEPDLLDHPEEEEKQGKEASGAASNNNNNNNNNNSTSDEAVFLPEEGSAEKEHSNSLTIFFVLSILMLCIFLIHTILKFKFHYLPESLAIVFLGAVVGLTMRLMPTEDVKSVESFSPTMFFLVLLPPIIFESGYNLHKGNFFANLGSILIFAIFGTIISALVVGGGVYLLGLADVVYKLDFVESFAFGSLISAVDPVATLAIFQALDVDPVLNMLVFGESILNDAVAIVLTTTVLESAVATDLTSMQQLWHGIGRFLVIFLGSAAVGTFVGLISSLTLKHVDLYQNPSLEFGLMLCFVYSPYAFAEGIHLSGIMSILFAGIVMSQYTHYNLSPVTQITMQQTMRTLAFICESCVFAYLGLAIFSFPLRWETALIIWSIVFILIGRACNIFPLSMLCNKFRQHQITKKMMLIMWFSGLRGAIAYALSLHLEFDEDKRKVIVTTTLVVVLFTTVGLGGGTMPLMKYLEKKTTTTTNRRRKRRRKEITLSKTRELGATIDSEHLSEMTEEELETSLNVGNNDEYYSSSGLEDNHQSRGGLNLTSVRRIRGFLYYDLKYFRPLLTRKFTQRELKEGQSHVTKLTDKWIHGLGLQGQSSPLMLTDSEEEFNQQHD